MKVLYIVNSTSSLGGASKSLLVLLDGLSLKGVHPIVITPDTNGLYNVLKARGIQVYSFKYRPNTYPYLNTVTDFLMFIPRIVMRRILSYFATRKVIKLCKKDEVQLIHTNVSVIDIGYKASIKLKIPHIFHFREFCDIDFNEHYYPSKYKFYKKLEKYGSYSICVTKTVQEYHKLYGSRSEVIYNGIERSDGGLYDFDKKRQFLYVGRIEPAKGLMQIIDAYNDYRNKIKEPYKLLVVGSICDKRYYKLVLNRINQYCLNDNVCFLGERNDVARFMQEVSAIIISSRFEAFGRCMSEAMKNGCLVIGKNTGGTKEQFDNGLYLTGIEIGLRYETTNDLVCRLIEVTSSSSHSYTKMKKAALNTVTELYPINKYIERVFNFYNKILCDN